MSCHLTFLNNIKEVLYSSNYKLNRWGFVSFLTPENQSPYLAFFTCMKPWSLVQSQTLPRFAKTTENFLFFSGIETNSCILGTNNILTTWLTV